MQAKCHFPKKCRQMLKLTVETGTYFERRAITLPLAVKNLPGWSVAPAFLSH